ncbi:MAG: ribosome maturation factor RimP [Terriglobales bacterium]
MAAGKAGALGPAPGKWHALAEQVVAASGLELVAAELRGEGSNRLLRVTIDRAEGVGLADCERVSRALGAALEAAPEAEAALAGPYTLEISSPGLDRPLVKAADFARFTGQRVQVRVRAPLEGSRHWFGILLGGGDQGVRLRSEAGDEITIPWENLSQARLAPLWPRPRRPGKP